MIRLVWSFMGDSVRLAGLADHARLADRARLARLCSKRARSSANTSSFGQIELWE